MKQVLLWVGIIFILTGIFLGISQIDHLNGLKSDADYWNSASITNSDNPLIEEKYNQVNASYTSQLTYTVTGTVSGIISGIFFLALSTIVGLLQKLVDNRDALRISNESNEPTVSMIN